MKKLFAFITVLAFLALGTTSLIAQEEVAENPAEGDTTELAEGDTLQSEDLTASLVSDEETETETEAEETKGFHKQVKELFIKGGAIFMSFVLLALIFGLAIAIERIIYLNLATTNTKKLLDDVESALENGGIEAAKDVCRDTRGPVASIFYQGLMKYDEGVDMVEKSVIAYGSVQTGLLEKNLSWVALFIALAPMLGFMGTVIGMIKAFADIEKAGEVSAQLVAGGIQIALITTVSGLVVAVILQVFYNYLVSKIDGLTNNMEDSSISFMDLLVKFNLKK